MVLLEDENVRLAFFGAMEYVTRVTIRLWRCQWKRYVCVVIKYPRGQERSKGWCSGAGSVFSTDLYGERFQWKRYHQINGKTFTQIFAATVGYHYPPKGV